MKLKDESTVRILTLELTEEEAKDLHGLVSFYPTNSSERRSERAQRIASELSEKLWDADISCGSRTEFVRS